MEEQIKDWVYSLDEESLRMLLFDITRMGFFLSNPEYSIKYKSFFKEKIEVDERRIAAMYTIAKNSAKYFIPQVDVEIKNIDSQQDPITVVEESGSEQQHIKLEVTEETFVQELEPPNTSKDHTDEVSLTDLSQNVNTTTKEETESKVEPALILEKPESLNSAADFYIDKVLTSKEHKDFIGDIQKSIVSKIGKVSSYIRAKKPKRSFFWEINIPTWPVWIWLCLGVIYVSSMITASAIIVMIFKFR